MRRPKTHDVDELAQRIFKSAIPSDWVAREQHPDYGIDYIVEIFEHGEPTRFHFAVQLKGRRHVQSKGGAAHIRLAQGHLAYYLDKNPHPVFLVVVDVNTKQACWLFTQGYALDELHGKPWRNQKTVAMPVPLANDLADSRRLREAVELAVGRVAELHPASIEGAIASERKRVESIDPRFKVEVEVKDGKPHYHLFAKENVEVSFCFQGQGDEVQRKVEALVSRGEPITLSPGEVEVAGTPLLGDLATRGGTLQSSRVLNISASITALAADGTVIGSLEHLPGQFRGGVCHFQGECALGESLFVVKFPYGIPPPQRAQIQFSWNPREWLGRPVRHLPYFDKLYSFLRCIRLLGRLEIAVEVEGYPLKLGTAALSNTDGLRPLVSLVECLARAREVAAHFSVSPCLPADFGRQHWDEIEAAYGLLRNGEFRRPGKTARFSAQLALRDFPARVDDLRKPGALRVCWDGHLAFLGSTIDAGPLEFELSEARCDSNLEELQDRMQTCADETVGLDFVGTPDSVLTLRSSTRR